MIRRAILATALLALACTAACADAHTVKPGENLYVIAKQYGVSVTALVRHNGITNQRLIRPGMVLEIPADAGSPAPENPPAVAAAARAKPSTQPSQHIVTAQSQPKPDAEPISVAQPEPTAQPESAPDAAASQPASAAPAATPSSSSVKPLLPLTLGARSGPEDPARSEPQRKGVSAGMIANLMLKLGLVLLFVYLSVWALKKVSQRRGRLLPGRGPLQVLETTSLAPNRGLHLIAVGRRVFLIGSTPESITILGDVSEETDLCRQPDAQTDKPSFGSQLQSMFKRDEPAQGLGGVIASLRDGTFFIKRAAERARAAGRAGAVVDGRG